MASDVAAAFDMPGLCKNVQDSSTHAIIGYALNEHFVYFIRVVNGCCKKRVFLTLAGLQRVVVRSNSKLIKNELIVANWMNKVLGRFTGNNIINFIC